LIATLKRYATQNRAAIERIAIESRSFDCAWSSFRRSLLAQDDKIRAGLRPSVAIALSGQAPADSPFGFAEGRRGRLSPHESGCAHM